MSYLSRSATRFLQSLKPCFLCKALRVKFSSKARSVIVCIIQINRLYDFRFLLCRLSADCYKQQHQFTHNYTFQPLWVSAYTRTPLHTHTHSMKHAYVLFVHKTVLKISEQFSFVFGNEIKQTGSTGFAFSLAISRQRGPKLKAV